MALLPEAALAISGAMASASSTRLIRLLPVYFVVFAGFVGYSLMIAVFTPMFLEGHERLVPSEWTTGQKTILLGFVLCIYPLGQFLSSPVIGALSDRYGRRLVLLVTLGLSILCYVAIAVAIQWNSLALLIVALLAGGLSEGNIVIAQSAISDVTDEAGRGRLFGYIYMSASSAYVVGPLAGGKLASQTVLPWFSYDTPFWAVGVLLLATLALVAVVFRETRTGEAAGPIRWSAALTNLRAVWQRGPLRRIYVANFVLYLGIFGFLRCYAMYMVDEFHLDVSQVSEFLAWFSVPLILGSLVLAGYFTSKYPARLVTIWSGLLTAAAMVLVVIPRWEQALWGTLFIAGLPLAVCLAACATTLSLAAPKAEQGAAMGNNQALQVFAEAVSGLIGGLIASLFIKASLLAMAVFMAIGAVVMMTGRGGRGKAAD